MLLRGLSDDAAFRPFFRLFRRRSSIAYRQLVRQALWQDGYFDRILRPYEDSMRIVDYIVNNPVRARLVERPGDYPYVFVRQP